MVTVPYNPVPTVNPSTSGVGYQHINASPDSFGGAVGRALQSTGHQLEGAAGEIVKVAMHAQDIVNQAGSHDLAAQWMANEAKISAEFRLREGRDAVASWPKYQEQMEKLRKDTLAKATNPAQRNMLDAQISRQYMFGLSHGAGHMANEAFKYNRGAKIAREDMLGQNAAGSTDLNEWALNADEQEKSIRATRTGPDGAEISPEAMDILVLKKRSESFSAFIKNQADKNPDVAEKQLNAAKEKLLPTTVRAAEQYIKGVRKTKESSSLADTAADGRPLPGSSLPDDGTKLTDKNWNLQFYKPEDMLAPTAGGRHVDARAATMADRAAKRFFDETGIRVAINDPDKGQGGTAGRRRGTADPEDNPHVSNSQHLHGKAFDFQTQNLTEAQKSKFLTTLIEEGFTGFGFYKSGDGHLHADAGASRNWHDGSGIPAWAAAAMGGAKPREQSSAKALAPLSGATSPQEFQDNYYALSGYLDKRYPDAMDTDVKEKVLANYRNKYSNIKSMAQAAAQEGENILLAAVNGVGKPIGVGTENPIKDFSEIENDPKLFRQWNTLQPQQRRVVLMAISKNATGNEEAAYTPEHYSRLRELEGRLASGEAVSNEDIYKADLRPSDTKSLVMQAAKLDGRPKPAWHTAENTKTFDNLMVGQFGVARNSQAYFLARGEVEAALSQVQKELGVKPIDQDTIKAITFDTVRKTAIEHKDLFMKSKPIGPFSDASEINRTITSAYGTDKKKADAARIGLKAAYDLEVGRAQFTTEGFKTVTPAQQVEVARKLVGTKLKDTSGITGGFFGAETDLAREYPKIALGGIRPMQAVELTRVYKEVNKKTPSAEDVLVFARTPLGQQILKNKALSAWGE